MADKTTTSLTGATTPLDGAELHYVIQGGNSRKVAGSEIVKISHNQAWSTITSTPTTLSGYGITDAATSAQGGKADTALQPGDIGDTVQAHDDQLDDLAALAPGSDGQVIGWQDGELATFNAAGGGDLLSSNNLSDLSNVTTAKTNLGLGTVATSNDYSDLDNLPTLGTGAALDAPSNPDLSVDTDKLALRGDVLANVTAKSVAEASALAPVSAPDFIQTAGYASAGDGGGALYKKVAVEPSHEGKFSITLDDGVTVVWFEIAETTIPVKALGAIGDTVSVTVTASITSGSASLTAVGAAFTSDDVGKLISIPGAGATGGFLGSTISAVTDATHVTLADNASTTLSAVSKTITYGTDDTSALMSALEVAAGKIAFFAPGVYSITKAALAYSNTTIQGVYGASIIKPATKYTGAASYDGACIRNSTFATASSLDEEDILVEDLAFDYTCRPTGVGGQQVGVFLRYVSRPKVLRCIQWSGGDLNGFLRCKDTETAKCVAYDINNCAYDHWSSTGYVIVSNCITRSDSISPNQCIQVTGDDTTPGSSTLLGTGHVEKIIIEGNIIDCPGDGTVAGIIINCLDGGASASDVVIDGNYVRGVNYGIALQGAVDGFVISDNVIRSVLTQGILLTKSAQGTSTQPTDGVISDNLVADCGAIGIDIAYGDNILIKDNKVSSPTTRPIRLQTGSSNCIVKDNMTDDGASGGIQDLGTGNTIMKIGASQPKSVSSAVYSGSAAPTSFTDLDLSSVVGANKAICTARVLNQSGSTASFIFRTNGDGTVETAPATAGTGPNICSMQNNEANYVTFITDGAGIVEWCSTVGAGTTTITLLSYQPLQ